MAVSVWRERIVRRGGARGLGGCRSRHAGLSPEDAFDTYASISVHTQGAAVLERLQDRSSEAEPYRRSGSSVIDPETMPLIAELTEKGHRIGVADDINFEYGLNCILEHASRLIAAAG